MKVCLFVVFVLCFPGKIGAQSFPKFKNEALFFKNQKQSRGLLPAAFLDVNGDLVDDLVSIHNGAGYQFLLGNSINKPLLPDSPFVFNHYFDSFGLAVGDLNGDGIPDYVTGGSFGYIHVLLSHKNGRQTILLPAGFLVQTINLVDVNGDGFPDIFVCNDLGPNTIFLNQNGQGFIENKNFINFSTIPASDMSGNYGSVWVDINDDQRLELAIAKCKAGVSDPRDPRRVNVLYMIDSTGVWRNMASEYGFDLGEQSWAVAFADFDNDEDIDAFVVNHYDPHVLLENKAGKGFQKINFSDFPVSSFAFQVISRDFDNDGLLDVVLSGLEGVSFLHNKGNMKFSLISEFDGPMPGMSVTAGDINDDGWIDLHAQVTEPLNYPGREDDKLYVNQGGQNHYFKCNLSTLYSGRSVIGASVTLFGPWGKQTRQITAGEGYGITNSFQLHFGLASHQTIDSLRVQWPSGFTDVYHDLEINSTYFVQENSCASKVIRLTNERIILNENGTILEAPEGYEAYTWNNGGTTRSIQVIKEGMYHVLMRNGTCQVAAKPFYVERGCFPPNTELLADEMKIVACAGEQVKLSCLEGEHYLWNTGQTSRHIIIQNPGLYVATATDYCGNEKTDSISLEYVEVPEPMYTYPDTVPANTTVELLSSSEMTHWLAPDSLTILASGATFAMEVGHRDTIVLARAFTDVEAKVRSVGITGFPALNQYGSNGTQGGIRFNVMSPIVINHVKVYTDTPGKRRIIILDKNGKNVFSKEFYCIFGNNDLMLNATLPAGNQYFMTTDESVNNQELGYAGPRFLRHASQGILFPYTIENVISLTGTQAGTNYYYYFYDWNISFDFRSCYSTITHLPVAIDTSTAVVTPVNGPELEVYPNPARDILECKISSGWIGARLEVRDAIGHRKYDHEVNGELVRISVESWPPGMYTVTIFKKNSRFTTKIIIY